MERPITDFINLIDPSSQRLWGLTVEEAQRLMLSDEPTALSEARGSFALVARDGERVCLTRSLDRPLRYFLAKQESGPLLIVAERIDEISQ